MWMVFIGVATLVKINDLISMFGLKLDCDTDASSYTRENALCTSMNQKNTLITNRFDISGVLSAGIKVRLYKRVTGKE